MDNKLSDLQAKINIKFKNVSLLENALVHRSFINENKNKALNSNERLEYLGDAVLELVVSEFLYSKYGDLPEGDLTSFRSALVKTESLAEEAKRLGLGEYIFMSLGEESTGGRERPYILANTTESIIGAIYLDQGYKAAKAFILENICHKIEKIVENRLDIDAKSKLQEITQEELKITPKYEFIGSHGPDHDKLFTMAVFAGTFKLAEGVGKSKQDAERNAALKALDEWSRLEEEIKALNA